jgi:hypothetical protein
MSYLVRRAPVVSIESISANHTQVPLNSVNQMIGAIGAERFKLQIINFEGSGPKLPYHVGNRSCLLIQALFALDYIADIGPFPATF